MMAQRTWTAVSTDDLGKGRRSDRFVGHVDAHMASREFQDRFGDRQLEALMPGVIEVTTYQNQPLHTKRGPNPDQMLSGF